MRAERHFVTTQNVKKLILNFVDDYVGVQKDEKSKELFKSENYAKKLDILKVDIDSFECDVAIHFLETANQLYHPRVLILELQVLRICFTNVL